MKLSLALSILLILFAGGVWGEDKGVSYTKHGIDQFDDKEWNKYSTNKALALGRLGDKGGGYLCYGKSSVYEARVCAKSRCEAQGYPCFIAAVNAWEIESKEEAQKAYAEAKEKYLKRQKKKVYASSSSKKKTPKELSDSVVEPDKVDVCLARMELAKQKFLKTCSGPATSLDSVSHYFASRAYCQNKANDRFDETNCFLGNSAKENKTKYTLWLITRNGADRFATYDDYGQCMDSCQKLTQPCDCKVD